MNTSTTPHRPLTGGALRAFLALALIALAALPSFAAEPLKAALTVSKVVSTAQGEETLVSAETAAPGEVIAYQAVYTNTSDEPLQAVKVEIPIPTGLTLIEGSAVPRAVEGSLDGETFAALPLIDTAGQPVPAGQVRALRWSIPALSPSESVTVSLRATVDAR